MSAGYMRKCAGKIRHATKEEAEKQRTKMVAAGKWTRQQSNTYRCSQCGQYHCGHVGTRFRGKGPK